jgi:hypothetical protein
MLSKTATEYMKLVWEINKNFKTMYISVVHLKHSNSYNATNRVTIIHCTVDQPTKDDP